MEKALTEYWKKRCELAEKVITAGSYEMTKMTDEQLANIGKWDSFIQSPILTALHTGFIDLLKANGMWYELFDPTKTNNLYELRFGKSGTEYEKTGVIVTAWTLIDLFERAVEVLKSKDRSWADI